MSVTPVGDNGWTFDRNLGAGGFGIVQLWVHKQSGQKLAIKKCRWDQTQLKEYQENRWTNEVKIMKHLKHRNIVQALDMPFRICNEDTHLPILCMEYCKKGDLRRVLNQAENCCGIAETDVVNLIRDISAAVEYLHSLYLTHRDLKPENIVIQDEHGKVTYKLIDLGYAKELGENSTSASLVGTLNYVAPELFWKKNYSCAVDYWSLGILFYELITGIRPFLPGMTHTITWMKHIKNKAYEDICAFERNGQIIFGKDIQDPTQISQCFRKKLVDWFRVALQWDSKMRGKVYDSKGESQLVIFKMLQSILSKKIVYVFFAPRYKLEAYEVTSTTTIAELQQLIEDDSKIPCNQQILTDYLGKALTQSDRPVLSVINDSTSESVIFVFQSGCTLRGSIPPLNIPIQVQEMIAQARAQIPFDALQNYYRAAIFFIKQEVYYFRLYIFAVTIKVDLLIWRLNEFDKNITDATANINDLTKELETSRSMCNDASNVEEEKTFETVSMKVTNLNNAADQIKLIFGPLIKDSRDLQAAATSIYSLHDLVQLYDNALAIYESFKKENSHKPGKPTEMVKIVFGFVKARETESQNEKLNEVLEKTYKLENELQKLEKIFDSVIALTSEYRNKLQNLVLQKKIKEHKTNNSLRDTTVIKNESNSGINVSSTTVMDTEDDVIYDNVIIRHTQSLIRNAEEVYADDDFGVEPYKLWVTQSYEHK